MTTLKIPLKRPIRSLRTHSRDSSPPSGERVTWLLSLRDREKQRRAEAMALQAVGVSITDACDSLPGIVGERLDEIAGIAVDLGLAVAREIVGAALDRGAYDPTPTVVRCLRDCVHGSSKADLVVHLHPEDLAIVERGLAEKPELREQVARTSFVADPGIGRGAVRAETEAGRLKYDPREALERVSEEVRREVTA